MNALLFGVAPVTLAAVIVAAFLIVSPGKGSASSLGFKAGPAPGTQQLTASAMAAPSPVAVCLALGSQEEAPARDEFGLARGQDSGSVGKERQGHAQARTQGDPAQPGSA